MTRTTIRNILFSLAAVVVLATSAEALTSDDLVIKSCTELLVIAEGYQQDVKTVDVMLASAIDAGDLERIKTYRLRKNAIKKQLNAVLKAIEIKGCSTR